MLEEAVRRTLNMTDMKRILKNQGPKLVPFFTFVVIYFVFVRDPHGELWTSVLKCAPIVCLILYSLPKGVELTEDYKYSQRISLGLIFSCVGDALLNIDFFPYGMSLFALAQVCYISAFGFKPLKWLIAVPFYLAGSVSIAVVFKELDQVLVIGLPIYIFLLLTMCWRALARAAANNSFLYTLSAIGSVFFVISDSLIGIDMFLIKVPNARIWIMITYYVAQFAIALSTANESLGKKSSKGKNTI